MKGLCIAPNAHHLKTACSNAPGSLKREALALKALRQARHLGEPRFQRLYFGNRIPRAVPQAERDFAPLALQQE
jgi:hypothetical protein